MDRMIIIQYSLNVDEWMGVHEDIAYFNLTGLLNLFLNLLRKIELSISKLCRNHNNWLKKFI
jgi:hypothetical protein